jgi:nucleotide-binding universal stress UspA family protein
MANSFGKNYLMEKILLALEGAHLHSPAVDFACWVGGLTHSKITGVILENLEGEENLVVREAGFAGKGWQVDKGCDPYVRKNELVEKNINFFKQACERRAASYAVHRHGGDPAAEIVQESRFADLLIVDAETSFRKRFEGSPTTFVKDTLAAAECPVIIAPDNFEGIEEIVFTWDGSKSSMFAIKQFCYLFPKLEDRKVTLLKVDKAKHTAEEDKAPLKDWLSSHYSSIGFETLQGDTETELLGYLLKKKNVFIIMGAYGRNMLSRFFKQSRAEIVIKTITQAIFIAHV